MSVVRPINKGSSSSSGGAMRPLMSVAKKVDRPARPAGTSWVDGSGGVGDRPQLSTLRRTPFTDIVTASNENSLDTSLASVTSQRVRAPRLNAESVGRQENTAREIQEMNLRALASYATRRPGDRRRSSSSNVDDAASARGRPQRAHSAAGAPHSGSSTGVAVLPHHTKAVVDSIVRAAQLPTAASDDAAVPKRIADAIYGSHAEHDRERVAAATPTQLLRWRSSTPTNVDVTAAVAGGTATPVRRLAQSSSPYRSVAMGSAAKNAALSSVSIRTFSLLPLEVTEVPRIARPSRSPSPVVHGHAAHVQRSDVLPPSHEASIPSRRMPTLSPPRKPNPHSTAPSSTWGAKRHTPVARTKVPDETTITSLSSSSDPDSPPRARSVSPLAVPLEVEPHLTSKAPPQRGVASPRQGTGREATAQPSLHFRKEGLASSSVGEQRPSLSAQATPKYCWSCGDRHPDGAHGAIRFCCSCGARVI